MPPNRMTPDPAWASGVVAVDKPEGPTSRRVVDAVSRALGTRKVGHAGTLDPFATGVVLVVWGRATRLVPHLQALPKTYRARVRFGRVTDTQDKTGAVLAEADAASLTSGAVERALEAYRGDIEQVPPMYSALKVDGRRLYAAARAGEDIERAPRRRTVHAIRLAAWDPPCAEMEVTCSAGTYIRTLAHDLGQDLGPGASLDALDRVAVGDFRKARCVPLERLEPGRPDAVLQHAFSPAAALSGLPALVLDPADARAVAHGSWRDPEARLVSGQTTRLLNGEGRLVALADRNGDQVQLRVFLAPEDLA